MCSWFIISYWFQVKGLTRWLSGKESTCDCRRCRFNPWVGKIPWRRKWQPTPVFLPRKSHKQRCLIDCSPPGSSVHGIFQAIRLEWVPFPSPGGSSWSRNWTHISCTGRWVLYPWATWEVTYCVLGIFKYRSSLLTMTLQRKYDYLESRWRSQSWKRVTRPRLHPQWVENN